MNKGKAAETVKPWSFLPRWLAARERDCVSAVFASDAARMAAVIALAEENVRRGGGPFGAAVFDCAGGRCVAVGVNRVVAGRCSHLHAEMVALARAQQTLGTHDLGTAGRFALFTSVEGAARVEKVLNRLPGVNASVNFATETARVNATVAPDTLIQAVEKAGYGAHVKSALSRDDEKRQHAEAYHAEWTHDESGKVTFYLLDAAAIRYSVYKVHISRRTEGDRVIFIFFDKSGYL
jgi:copper chaperone CopZ